MITSGVEQFTMRSRNLLILFGIRKNFLSCGRSWSFYISIRRAIKQMVVIMGAYYICQLCTKLYPTSFCQGELQMLKKLLQIEDWSLPISERIILTLAFINSAGIWSIPGDLCPFSFSITTSTSKALGPGTSCSAVCISFCLTPLTPCTLNSWEKCFLHLAKILWQSVTKSPFSSFALLVLGC